MAISRQQFAVRAASHPLSIGGRSATCSDRQLLEQFAIGDGGATASRPSSRSRPWSSGMGRWSSVSARRCCAIRTTPRTPFRRPFSSSCGKPASSGFTTRSGPGFIAWPSEWPFASRRRRGAAAHLSAGLPSREPRRFEAPRRSTPMLVLHEEIDRLPERFRVPGRPLPPGGPEPGTGGQNPAAARRNRQEPAASARRPAARPTVPAWRRLLGRLLCGAQIAAHAAQPLHSYAVYEPWSARRPGPASIEPEKAG